MVTAKNVNEFDGAGFPRLSLRVCRWLSLCTLCDLAMIMCSIFLFNVRYLSPCGFPILCGRGEGETLDRDRIVKVRRPAGMKSDSPHGYW